MNDGPSMHFECFPFLGCGFLFDGSIRVLGISAVQFYLFSFLVKQFGREGVESYFEHRNERCG